MRFRAHRTVGCIALSLLVWGGAEVFAQADSARNLLPNPGFEEFRVRPIGWYYRGEQFDRVMRYWRSPTAASPDAYRPGVRVPVHWLRQGFGERAAHGGGAMIGLTLYGCAEGKPHCREYVQTQLIEPLVAGQRYRFSVWVATLDGGLHVDQLAAAFTERALGYADERPLDLAPEVAFGGVRQTAGEWIELSREFVATGDEHYIVLGNFADDAHTVTGEATMVPELPFAYYYLDDASLTKVDPILAVEPAEGDLARKSLRRGTSLTLEHVYFDRDSDELEPRSFVELDKLAALMRAAAGRNVRIIGHTDAEGDPAYNDDLSRRRAARVVAYLQARGVEPVRLSSEGRGMSEPVAENDSGEGRALNRRVVALVE